MGLGEIALEGGDAGAIDRAIDDKRMQRYAQGPGLADARRRLAEQMGGRGGVAGGGISDFVNSSFGALAAPKKGDVGDWSKTLAASDESLKQLEKHMKALGAAATPAEKLTLEIGKLNNALAHGNITQAEYTRSLDAFVNAQTEAMTAARERLGVASQEEIYISGLIKLQQDRADGFIRTDAEMAQAEARLREQAEQTYKQEQVKNSAFKGLAQMGQGDTVNDSIDKVGTSALNDFGKTIDDVLTTKPARASDTWRKLALSIDQSIEQMIVKMLVLKPLAAALSGGLGGLFGGATASSVPEFTNPAYAHFAGGGIMTSRGPVPLRRYAGGGVASSPQLALFGEGSGPEAFVPLRNGGIPVNLNGARSGHTFVSNTNVSVTVPPGTSPEAAHQMAANFGRQMRDTVSQMVDERIITHLRTGGLLNPA